MSLSCTISEIFSVTENGVTLKMEIKVVQDY